MCWDQASPVAFLTGNAVNKEMNMDRGGESGEMYERGGKSFGGVEKESINRCTLQAGTKPAVLIWAGFLFQLGGSTTKA